MHSCHRPRLLLLALSGAVLIVLGMASVAAPERSVLVYIGTYTGAKSQGIYMARFDASSGRLSTPELAAETRNPTFLALGPGSRFLYAANEVANHSGQRAGAVSAFSIDKKSGKLTLQNQQPSGGTGPCHVALDHSGKCVLAANYGSGSVAAFRREANGELGEPASVIQHHGSSVNRQRQEGPHAHFITADPRNRFALACDLGLDKVLVYRLDPAKAILQENDPPALDIKPGSGPRHIAFHPNGRWVYVINELNSTMVTCEYNSNRGELRELQNISTLPSGFSGNNSCAEVAVHPSGKFVYGSNRGEDSIAIFSVDPKAGTLSYLGGEKTRGKTPRHFAVDPSGKWLLAENQDSNDIFTFQVDAATGRLEFSGERVQVGAPVCLVFVP